MNTTSAVKTLRMMAASIGIGLVLATSSEVQAKTYSPVNAAVYYEIGGAELVNKPPTSIKLGGTLSIGPEFMLPSVCDVWERKLWKMSATELAAFIGKYVIGVDIKNLGPSIVAYLATAAQTIAVAALQRALPGMYDYSQNLFAQMQLDLDFATKTCQQVVDEMDAGSNPFDGWITTSKAMGWRTTLTDSYTAHDNILDVNAALTEKPHETSVNWFGGPKGGAGTDPIKLVTDVVSAGYATAATTAGVYSGTPVTAAHTHTETAIGGGAATVDDHLQTLFPSSADAATFANQVIGEQTISFCDTCTGSTMPGVGLKPTYLDEKEKLTLSWNTLLTTHPTHTTYPTIAEFDAVSSVKIRITKRLYSSLLSMDTTQDRDLFINRLISDVAVDRTVEKALALRQFLKSGYATPQVQAIPQAQADVKVYIDQIKHEIDDFQWEIETQNKMAAKTSSALLRLDTVEKMRRTGSSAPVYPKDTPQFLDDKFSK